MTDLSLDKPDAHAADRNQWWDVWDQFKTHKGAVIGLGFLIFITLFCAVGPWLWGVDPGKLDIRNKDVRPIYMLIFDSDAKTNWANPMGTDNLGRDIMANTMQGGQISLAVGWMAMILALIIGDVIVFQQMLSNIEVVPLDLALRIFNRASDERVLDRLALLHAQLLHDAGDAIRCKDSHQVVFER